MSTDNTWCRGSARRWWKILRHPNILPLIGVTISENLFAMISDWMTNRNINEFVKKHSDVNLFKLVGFHSKFYLLHSNSLTIKPLI